MMATPTKIYKKVRNTRKPISTGTADYFQLAGGRASFKKLKSQAQYWLRCPNFKEELSNANGRFITPSSTMNGEMLTSG